MARDLDITTPKPHPSGILLPDTATFKCPSCSVLSLHRAVAYAENKRSIVWRAEVEPWEDCGLTVYVSETLHHHIFRCHNCEQDTYFLRRTREVNDYEYKSPDDELPKELFESRIIHQYPLAIDSVHESVPAAVASASLEAEKCVAVGAFNACGVMTRRAMHSLCEDKGVSGENLYVQLETLKKRHLITPDLWEWAEELRVLGKHGAHPEWPEVSEEDAEYGMKFLRQIIQYVYINRWEREQKRIKETSKKNPESAKESNPDS